MNHLTGSAAVSQRNYGIDLLRIVAAFYVIILHTLNQGGIYEATINNPQMRLLCRLLLIISYCSVNIFGIISGYVGYREPIRKISYAGYLPLWLTVVFYSVLFTGAYGLLIPGSVNIRSVIKAFLPVTCNVYWYFSAFTMVYLFSPFLNRILYYSSDRELKYLLFLICTIISPLEFFRGTFALHNGYSAHWLILLYLVGGIMKKTKIFNQLSVPKAVLGIVILDLSFLYLGSKWPELSLLGSVISFSCNRSYTAPFYLWSAMIYVILFSKMQFGSLGKKFISFSAPAAFSVYIANTNPLFFTYFMEDHFVAWAGLSPAELFCNTVLFSLCFVSGIILLDSLRQKLFSLLGVKTWIQKMSCLFHKAKAV